MATLITKKNSTIGVVPNTTQLEVGELAVNTADGKLYTKHTDNTIKTIGFNLIPYEVNLGNKPRKEFKFTITDSKILSTSKVVVYPDGTPATNRGTDDWEWDTAQFAVKTTNGSCTVYCIFTGKVKGNRKILYVIN